MSCAWAEDVKASPAANPKTTVAPRQSRQFKAAPSHEMMKSTYT